MIYFLTDWQSEPNFESDIVFNVNTIFREKGLATKIINTKISPFLNYLMNGFENYDSKDCIQLIETVSDHLSFGYAPLTIHDLNFSKNWEKIFTRKSVRLSKKGLIKAEVFINSFGFVSQVHYFTSLGKEIQVYSEKGTLFTQTFFDSSGDEIEHRIFDEKGRVILTKWGGVVFIEATYQKRFKKKTYDSFKEVCRELLHLALVNFNPKEDRLVIDGMNGWVMSLIEDLQFTKAVVYVFSGPSQTCHSQVAAHLRMIEEGKGVITDNLCFIEEVKKEKILLHVDLQLMPLYPTALQLGESNQNSEDYVYWRIGGLTPKVDSLLFRFLEMRLDFPNLKLIIDVEKSSDSVELEEKITNFLEQHLKASSDYEFVKRYQTALEYGEMTLSLRDLFYRGISFRINSSVERLKADFETVRVFIDQRLKYDFLSHSLAVSAGIPILSKTPSLYLVNEKNGLLYEEEQDLIEAVQAYLTDPDLWNQSLVESVEVIENNSAEGLIEKWKEVLK